MVREAVGLTVKDTESLDVLRANIGVNCMPSNESIDQLCSSNLILVSGQFVGGGKSTFIESLETTGRDNIASWTNRDLRQGEVEGIDKVKGTLAEMAGMAATGQFLELEEVRPGIFYATPAALSPGQGYVKDLELKGALRLRSFAPELPIIVPLPPLTFDSQKQVTEWERRVIGREGLAKAVSGRAITDLGGRLAGVIEEATRIEEMDLIDDPNTLIIVNDSLPIALSSMYTFLETGKKESQEGVREHIRQLMVISSDALGNVA